MNSKFEQRDMTGSLFPPRQETIVGQGPVKLFGEEGSCFLIESEWTSADGTRRKARKLAVVIGDLQENKQKRNENDSDYYCNGQLGDIPLMCWGRDKESQRGTKYTSLSFKEKEAKPRRSDEIAEL